MAFHIVVCIKSVVVAPPVKGIVRTATNSELNPFDLAAIEAALVLKNEHKGTLTALSMGPPVATESLHTALGMGADRAVLLSDQALAGSDTLATSVALSAGLKKLLPWDAVFFGTRTADSDTGQVGPQTCQALDIPLVTWAKNIHMEKGKCLVDRIADGFLETYEVTPPFALTISPDAAQPRDVGLLGVQDAFLDKSIETWDLKQIGLEPGQVGDAGSPTIVVSMKHMKSKRTCRFIEGPPQEQADTLLNTLSDKGLIG